jgi:hypothetical protein
MRNYLLACLAAAILTAASAKTASARPGSPGAVRGTVTDPSGAVVPGAVVLLRGEGTALTLVSDEAGVYVSPALAPGHYGVRIRARGFARFEQPELVVVGGEVTEADAPLVIRPDRESITISGASRLAR